MKVLACLDRSDQAPRVLENALELATWQKAELVFVTVVEDFIDFGEGVSTDFQDMLRSEGRKVLDLALARARDTGVAARAVLEEGPSAADAILALAEEEHPDVIVMGSRAKSGLDRFLIGSVASKVVTHAFCSVLVLRWGEPPKRNRPAPAEDGFPA
ncbi:Putative universal stress protein [Fundidesulfovibrio magnetotacticus]|uniref:Universal stress protein n=1 Tax=Fundidesulfovibrio magnetotacticus TaxID=2730080 RepID=A0A6V8LXR5_9BACT|nr:universal stress protein [Fundidesulfovibrio magnetotacticus]GFK95670.1 Putative universal stress protein [Fundidesulfovibrio magnetotacticus]